MPYRVNRGDIFNSWKVVDSVPNNARSMLCECLLCGKVLARDKYTVVKGISKSCGCRVGITHGNARRGHYSKEYKCWKAMKNRCRANSKYAMWYFEKGIAVCERWESSFDNFFSDMGVAPNDKMTVDRIDGSKDYEPGNCRWATRWEQGQNTVLCVPIYDSLGFKFPSKGAAAQFHKINRNVVSRIIERPLPSDTVLFYLQERRS